MGCSTLVNGPRQMVYVNSTPSGSHFTVNGGDIVYRTPVNIALKRNANHVITFKEKGFVEDSIIVTHVLDGSVMGNALCRGLGLAWRQI